MEDRKKITLFALCMLLIVAGTADAAEVISNLLLPIPVLGQIAYVVALFIGYVASFSIWLYLWLKGARHTRFICGAAAELLVGLIGLAFLPIRSVTLIIMYLIDTKVGQKVVGRLVGARMMKKIAKVQALG